MTQAPIKLGMVGGGADAFIGAVHRMAARLEGRFDLVAGALSSTPARAQASGAALGLDPARIYDDFTAMARAEAARPDGIKAVAIVTPNHLHAAAAIAFLRHGIHVICDKPLTATLAQARKLQAAVQASGALFILTHNYSGYPLVRQAREMVARGDLGQIRLVQVEYAQDWLARGQGNKQAAWRIDPAQAGAGGAIGDIGTHAFHLAGFVSGLTVTEVAADLQNFLGGALDDNAHMLLRFAGGARGMLWCSQVATGQENNLRLRVFGDQGALDWCQEQPNQMIYAPSGAARQILTRAGAQASADALRASLVPAGHPQGYVEAFAVIYRAAADAIAAHQAGLPPAADVIYPSLDDGMAGMRFIAAAVRSSQRGGRFVALTE